jgi:hypothetical protein
LRPLGPRVTRTASASVFTPFSMRSRASVSNLSLFGGHRLVLPWCLGNASWRGGGQAAFWAALSPWMTPRMSDSFMIRRSSRSPRRPRRAGHLPQPGERLLRSAAEGARPSRPGHDGRARGDDLGRRVGDRLGRMDQRPHPRPAVPGAVPEDLGALVDRGHREVPRLRHDPRHRPGLCQAHGQAVRQGRLRHHRGQPRAAAGGRGHRPEAGRQDHRGLGGSEGHPRDHGLPARARRRHGAGGAHLQDLRHRRRAGDEREPLSAGARHPRHRVPHRRHDRREARDREDRDDPRPRAGISYALTEAMGDGHCGLPLGSWSRLPRSSWRCPRR